MENSWVQKKGQIKTNPTPQISNKIAELEGDMNLQILILEVFPFVGYWLCNENALPREQEIELSLCSP